MLMEGYGIGYTMGYHDVLALPMEMVTHLLDAKDDAIERFNKSNKR